MNNLKFENVKVYNFEMALHGMRNPKNSWHLSDSSFGMAYLGAQAEDRDKIAELWIEKWKNEGSITDRDTATQRAKDLLNLNGILHKDETNHCVDYAYVGPKDMRLAQVLINGGSEHRKFLRQILVTVDITAPLYWWKEFDTYKVGTTANSTSTMHKLTEKPITRDCFKFDDNLNNLYIPQTNDSGYWNSGEFIDEIITKCEELRQACFQTGNQDFWKLLVEILPESWCQTRTVTMNYENLLSMCKQRRNHKLPEWREDFIGWARTLPYAQYFIFPDEVDKVQHT